CCIRSKRLMGVSRVPRNQIALALLTRMSRPPKRSTVAATAACTCASSRMSQRIARAWPPAACTASAAVWIVPGSFGLGTADLAAMATLAPSRAARRAMARPMPREAPVINRVLPFRLAIAVSSHAWSTSLARAGVRPAYNSAPMDSARLDALVSWIGQHPIAAGLVIFLIAFGDALVLVGAAIPAVPLVFAVGTLVGLGHVDGAYALACASLGAFAGDGISYWVGRRYGHQLRQRWPFAALQPFRVLGARRAHFPPA